MPTGWETAQHFLLSGPSAVLVHTCQLPQWIQYDSFRMIRILGLTFLLPFFVRVIRQSVLPEMDFPSSVPYGAQRLR